MRILVSLLPIFILLISKASAQFDASECGVSKRCFVPTTCPDGCKGMGASWRLLSDDELEIELFVKSDTPTGKYVALGISDDDKMGNEPVIECSSLGSEPISLKFSFDKAQGKGNNRLEGDFSSHFSDTIAKHENGLLYCKSKVKISGNPENSMIFKHDPTKQYHMLLANGKTKSAGVSFHSQNQAAVSQLLRLNDITGGFDDSQCGLTKGCTIPTKDTCYGKGPGIKISYRSVDKDHIEFEIEGPIESSAGRNAYVALGFSNHTKMNDISVIECSQLPGETKPSMKFSYNEGFKNVRIDGENAIRQNSIQQEASNLADLKIYCKAVVSVAGAANSDRIFKWDQTMGYYLMMAAGPTNDAGLVEHYGSCATEKLIHLDQVKPDTGFDTSECGKTKGCTIPTNGCYELGQGIQISYKKLDDDRIEFELEGPTNRSAGNNVYVALGFSNHTKMNDISVLECSQLPGESIPSMKFSYNQGFDNIRIGGEAAIRQDLIEQKTSNIADGKIYCQAVVKVAGTANNQQIFKWDQTMGYYLMMAVGPTNANGLTHHYGDCSTESRIYLDQVQPFVDDAECGKTKGCFRPQCENCDDIQATWRVDDQNNIAVELSAKIDATNSFIALGFSESGEMGPASVFECSSLNNEPHSLKYSMNQKRANIRSSPTSDTTMITDPKIQQVDGVVTCSGTFRASGSANDPTVFNYDPNQEYHLIVATGPTQLRNATDGSQFYGLGYHHTRRDVSPKQLLKNYQPASTQLPATLPTGTGTFDPSNCAKTKSCFDYTSGETIAYRIVDDATMEIEFNAKLSSASGTYVAVGFGQTPEMSPANVIECSSLGSDPMSIKFSYNGGSSNSRISGEEAIRAQYITGTEVSYTDGTLYCKGSVKIDGASNDQIFKFDKNQEYYLVVAKGSASAGGLGYHGQQNRWVSDKRALDALTSGGGSGNSPTLVILHAIFMTIAWLVLVPTAVIFARVLRSSWPNKKPFGLLIWFHIHRAANLLGIALMIAAFVLILVHKKWKFTTEGWGGKHAIIGIISLVLGWLQPFISTLRCSPSDPRRPIFNYVHRAIGITSMIFATTAICIAGYHFTGTRNIAQLVLALIPLSLLIAVSIFFLIFNKIVDDGDAKKFQKSQNGSSQSQREDIPMRPTSKSDQGTTWAINSSSQSSTTTDHEPSRSTMKTPWTNLFREFVVYGSVLAFVTVGTILSVFFALGFSS